MKTKLFVACLLTTFAAASAAAAGGLSRNWPMPPSELERRFATEQFVIREVKGAGGGVTGASKLTIAFADGAEIKVKWKAVQGKSADGWNNSIRKELAAYELQRWLVDENDFLVPTAAPSCIPMDASKSITKAEPTLEGSRCVLGMLAVWLSDVTAPKVFWNKKLFASNPVFANSMADFNVLTYLLDHRDGRQGNLLMSTDPADPRVFAVDNGIAFDPFPWNFLVTNWNKIHVPWLRRDTIERLRKVGKPELERLGVIAEMELDKDGIFRVVAPGANMKPSRGARITRTRVQFGLTREEIGELEKRLEELLGKIDDGKIAVR